MNVQARLPTGVVLDLGGCDLQQAGELIEALGRGAVFRLDEGLTVYLHRAPIDFRLNINGLAVLVEQARG